MAATSMRQRVARGVRAQVFGHVVRVTIQLVGVSIFIPVWGLHLYGEWLILTAIPSYLAFSDIGFVTAAANDMIMSTARGELGAARAVFQSIVVVLGAVGLLVVIGLPVLAGLVPLAHLLNLSGIHESTVAWVILALGADACLVLWSSLFYAGLACEGRYGDGAMWVALISLTEFCGLVAVVLLGAGVGVAASAMLAGRLAGTVGMGMAMRRRAPYLRFGMPSHVREHLRRLLSPALASGAFPLGFALTLQGMVIIVGAVLGPASAAVFSTLRTLSRAVIQLLASVSAVVMPEISKAFGEGNIALLRAINRRACQVAIWLALPLIAILASFGGPILRAWTSGRVGTEGSLLYLFLAITLVDTFWYTNMSVLIATNRHQRVAVQYVVVCIVALLLAVALLTVVGLPGAAIALLALEMFMAVAAIRRTLPAVNDDLAPFAAAVAKPPWYILAGWSDLKLRLFDPR